MNSLLGKIKEKLNKIKHKELIIAAILAIILLVVYFSGTFGGKKTTADVDGTDYCTKMSEDILDAVKLMTNSDGCKVIINWDTGVESVIAYTTSTTSSGTTQTPEIITNNGQSSPIILKEQFPKAISIAVVCPKETTTNTKLNIKLMVATLLGVDVNDIAIYNC